MRISSFSLFLSLVLFFYFVFITQAKEDTNTLLVDAGDNSIKMVSFPIDIGTPKNSNCMQKTFISFFFLKKKKKNDGDFYFLKQRYRTFCLRFYLFDEL